MGRTRTSRESKSENNKTISIDLDPNKLTKNQLYYRRHPELREKSKNRMREKREKAKANKMRESSPPNTPRVDNASALQENLHQDLRPTPAEAFDITEFTRFCEIREQVQSWASPWGGSWAWHYQLDLEYQKAAKEERIMRWVGEMLNHADIGRDLLYALSSMEGHLPRSDWQVKELWRVEVDLLRVVTEGLAALEARVNMLSDTAHGLLPKYQWPHDENDDEDGEEEDGEEKDESK